MNTIEKLQQAIRHREIGATGLADGTGVILDIRGNKVLSLNASAYLIFSKIESGVSDIEEIVAALTSEFSVDAETARRDVEELVSLLGELLE